MKTLIAFYSWSGTTKRLANKIHKLIPNSDLLEIKVPDSTFSSDMHKTASIYENQKSIHNLPQILNMPNNVNEYDLIVLGSPVWDWGVSSPVMSFIENISNFRGKVAPFYTSVGNSQRFMEFFHDVSGNLNVIQDFDDAHDDLNEWIKEITNDRS
ncbi:flavodoxin [Lactobacillus hamsteri]|uniref:Flavodoxin n=1 Tax=Lactobacillus hamsteri DSM 5661 = JCM 6256 TaxID=1423754 RepID=A0A0R1Y863_9LACO|nr:flavodoxin [Lactobacillus hamsteri]KRM38495.1 flavodoxin [Lactobacillus hamsteri DSM 5661 = JCM 6256]